MGVKKKDGGFGGNFGQIMVLGGLWGLKILERKDSFWCDLDILAFGRMWI